MDDETGEAQARLLLAALNGLIAEITPKLEAVDARNQRAQRRGIARRDPMAGVLRRELYEAHRLIDGIHRRFPHTAPYAMSAASPGSLKFTQRQRVSRAMVHR